MNRKTPIVITFFLFLSILASPVFAAPAVWTYSIDLTDSPVYLNSFSNNNYNFKVDITETGFSPGLDQVNDYALTIGMSDDGDCAWELVYVDLPGEFSLEQVIEVDYGNYGFNMSVEGLFTLNETGIFEVTLYALWGDFFTNGLQFEASGNNGNSVPLPASFFLLGTGLLGLLGVRRFGKFS